VILKTFVRISIPRITAIPFLSFTNHDYASRFTDHRFTPEFDVQLSVERRGLVRLTSHCMRNLPTIREMERAFLTSDASYDGVFFTAVRTTGIFCRPSCTARKPLNQNVEYFNTMGEAMIAGYRPCKRCRPTKLNGQPEWVTPLLARIDESKDVRIKDADLRTLGIDPARARRFFLSHYGMTFQAFCRARRMRKALDQLRQGADLDEVALGNGYESHSGFRDAFVRMFGQPPGRSRQSDCIVMSWIESPVGLLLAGATGDGICFLEFTDRRMMEAQVATLRKRFSAAIVPGDNRHTEKLKKELGSYFEGKLKEFSVPLIYPGSAFQVKVWNELLRIPHGETISYEELARRVGSPSAQRAVGHANGLNRIAIVIPCHRVINKGGKLGGYGGGLWRKQFLLDLESKSGSEPGLFD
jgi:AraC family transcriptional regulator, regulatory protein of adaptative response / methylated-DNA-[protein]-cysteine methyltransferase